MLLAGEILRAMHAQEMIHKLWNFEPIQRKTIHDLVPEDKDYHSSFCSYVT